MADETCASYKAHFAAIEAKLDAGVAADARGHVKGEIVGLFKSIEAQIAELTQLKDDIKQLVDKWKAVQAVDGAQAPQFQGDRPVVHADHLGASTFIEKGWSRLSLGDYEGAETALLKAIALSPGEARSEALLGWAQMLQGKHEDALMNFQQVLMREPANAIARMNMGYICLKRRSFGEAIEHLSKAIRLDNDRKATLYAHFYLGLVYLEREKYEDAQALFQRAIALGPNLIEAYYELGRAHWLNGELDRAREVWRRGHATNKFSPWGEKCAATLALVDAGGELPRS